MLWITLMLQQPAISVCRYAQTLTSTKHQTFAIAKAMVRKIYLHNALIKLGNYHLFTLNAWLFILKKLTIFSFNICATDQFDHSIITTRKLLENTLA